MHDFFRRPIINITPSIRPGQVSRLNPDVYPVSFMLDGKYRLTTLKVITLADAKTNKYPRPIWHMISDSASSPTKIIIYGAPIKGMKPSIPKARPEPLQPDTPYRLILEAGKQRGQVDFKTVEVVQPTTQPNR
jgi:hypothetical protein